MWVEFLHDLPFTYCRDSYSHRSVTGHHIPPPNKKTSLIFVAHGKTTNLFNSFREFGANTAPPKTNIEPKNGGLEDDLPFQTGDFQVRKC